MKVNKELRKGFFIQLTINIVAHLVRIAVADLIIKYAPEPQYPTSFCKDSGWQIVSLFIIVAYNIISLLITFISVRKTKVGFLYGFSIVSIIGAVIAWLILII